MELRCTCGALPPSDARFCHKCGRPLYEEDAALLAEVEKAATPTPPPVTAQLNVRPQPAISFRNMRALGISIAMAAATFVLMALVGFVLPSIEILAAPLILAGGGFMAAVVYSNQSRQPLSGGSGARLGWMTGIWFFLGFLFLVGIGAAVLSGPMASEVMHQYQSNPQLAKLHLSDPHELASMMLTAAVQMFFLAILFPIFGGVVGARFSSRNRSRA